jgi:F-type H+-transporting ATPase subunit c
MKNYARSFYVLALIALITPVAAFAQEHAAGGSLYAPLAAGLAIGIAALGGTLAQGRLASAIAEAIGRNPSASGKMNTPFFVGLALIESLVILSFAISYLLLSK